MIYVISISFIIMSILYIIQTIKNYNINKNFKELNLKFKQLENNKKEAFNVDIQLLQEIKESIEKDVSNYKAEVDKLQLQINEKLAANNALRKLRTQELDESIKAEREAKLEALALEVSAFYNMEKEKAKESLNHFITETEKQKELSMQELALIQKELEEYQKKRESINDAILREKEIQEQEDFYRIVVNEKEQLDILVLQDIIPKLNHREAISKLIWELYIRRPVQEMIKRITNGKKISGIYKITYLKTGEAYIGKTTDISTRWTNHIKTVCGLEGAAHSTLHTYMEDKGLWNFTFEILEEVEKDKLSEREAYYIDFYDTKR